MNILLVGEFSRLHNSLKEGLEKSGHNVTLIGSGDGFKGFNVDIDVSSKIKKSKILSLINSMFIRFFNLDFIKLENAFYYNQKINQLKGFDVIQLINEDALFTYPKFQIKFLDKLFSQNIDAFLLCCGNDYISVKYALDGKLKHSSMTSYLEDQSQKKRFIYALKYITPTYKKLHHFIYKNTKGVIASDMDYHIPLKNHPHYLGLIPNPINVDKIEYIPLKTNDKINIFHGINSHSSIKKGNKFFTEALFIIKKKYENKVNIIETTNLPYKEYINIYNNAHILLDQIYAYDQGYNALEAMAKGKVVFTGAEQEWLDHYNLEEDTVAINALPDVNYLVNKLEWLIENPDQINKISKNARQFIETHHDYKEVAKQYLATWQNNQSSSCFSGIIPNKEE
ncbi:glycosyltransferase [Mesoflavibacter zeaxanthinifaciens]|uniref:glycosyltransferase n=1 Tax=Mesoflavibacter zeaxanthinifaciens TaxID=393060 RepID=UPI003A95C4B8